MTGPIELESKLQKIIHNISSNNINEEEIIESLQSELENFVNQTAENTFSRQLAKNIQEFLPAIIQAYITNKEEGKTENIERIANALNIIISTIKNLQTDDINAFSQDLDFDPDRLQKLSESINKLIDNVNSIKRTLSPNKEEHKPIATNLKSAEENMKKSEKIVQNNIDANAKALKEQPEDISLQAQKIREEFKNTKNDANELRQALIPLFNINATSGLSEAAQVFENMNQSIIKANDEMERMQSILLNNQLDTPEAIQGVDLSLNTVRMELEGLINYSQDVFSNIAQSSLGDMSNFYTKVLNMGLGIDISTSEIKANLNKLNISDTERQQLEQVLDTNKQKITELLKITHDEFNTAFSKKIDDIVNGIDTEANKILNQFAVGRGLSQKYIHSFNQSGQAATNIWQIATGIEQTKDRFSLGSIIGLGKPNLSSIKENASIAGQLQFELQNSMKQFAGYHEEARKYKEKGLHVQSQESLKMANKLFANIINTQYEFTSKASQAIKQWNKLSEKEKKRLDPSGQMESTIKNLSRNVQTSNTSVIALAETFNIKIDRSTKYKLEQIKSETKDLVKLDQETVKSKDKTEDTMKQLTNFIQSAVNDIKSIVSSTKNIFNSFGNLGIAFIGPFETPKRLYEHHRKQGQLIYQAMGTDAYIGYKDLNDSAERAYNRLMSGNELYARSGGRIDREAYNKQYQDILRQVGGRYGSTPEQAIKDAEVLTNQSILLKTVYGVDDSTIIQTFKTYLKDMDKSPLETADALAQLTAQAQAANIPLGQYLSKVSSLAETFMQVGLEGEQASLILNMLLQTGVRQEVAEAVTSQVASVASKFSDDKNKVAFAAVMQGEDPFHALAQMAYTHTADGKVRKGWGKEVGSYLDTYLNTIMKAYGDDPNMRFIGIVDQLKALGFDSRSASMLGEIYIEQGNSQLFQSMLEKEQDKIDNPNAKMENLNQQINNQLQQMVGQLSESDKLFAQLDSNLYREAKHVGTGLDQILQTLTPAIIEFQKQMLKFVSEALKFIQKMVTSDLFKSITDSVVEVISNIPNFLKELENKLDELIGWGQSLIEGYFIALIYINYWNKQTSIYIRIYIATYINLNVLIKIYTKLIYKN